MARQISNRLLKYCKVALISGMSLVGILIACIFAILIWPQILINERTLQWGADFVEKNKGVSVHWSQVDVQIDSLALLRKRFGFYFKNLCVDIPESRLSSCTRDAVLSFAGSFSDFVPRILELGPIEVKNLRWKMGAGKKEMSGILDISGRERTGNELGHGGRWAIQVHASANLPDRSKAKLEALFYVNGGNVQNLQNIQLEELNTDYFIDASYLRSNPKAKASTHLEGTASSKHITSRISAVATDWVDGLPKLKIENCDLDLVQQSQQSQQNHRTQQAHSTAQGHPSELSQLQFTCPVQVKIPVPPDEFSGFKIPAEIRASLSLKLALSTFIPSAQTHIQGPIDIVFDPILSPFFTGNGKINSQVDGIVGEFPEKGSVNSHLAMSLDVPNYQKLVKELSRGEWAIPAPFHVMKGSEEFLIEGDSTLTHGEFPFSLKTRLASQAQVFNLDGSGVLGFEKVHNEYRPDLKFDLILSKIALVLPRLDWAAPPRLVPDARIQHLSPLERAEQEREQTQGKSNKKSQSSSFRYAVTVKTPPGKHLQVLSNLTQAPIPITVNLKMTDKTALEGQMTVEKFPVEVFRRKATLDHFTFKVQNPVKNSIIDGLLNIDYADYNIAVNVNGTVDKPFVKPTSNPPVSENQLYATLIFGQPIDELDSNQNDSVANIRAGVAQGAFNLASLYVLASTPVQSVNYDSATKTVVAKFKLGVGTSLDLGADTGTGTPTIGFKKRLGPSWTIETDVLRQTPNPDTGSQSIAEAYLQWSRRY